MNKNYYDEQIKEEIKNAIQYCTNDKEIENVIDNHYKDHIPLRFKLKKVIRDKNNHIISIILNNILNKDINNEFIVDNFIIYNYNYSVGEYVKLLDYQGIFKYAIVLKILNYSDGLYYTIKFIDTNQKGAIKGNCITKINNITELTIIKSLEHLYNQLLEIQ
jgi:hypothetical protein